MTDAAFINGRRRPLRFDRNLCPLPPARVDKYLRYVNAIVDKALTPDRIHRATPAFLRNCDRQVFVDHLAQVLIGNFRRTNFLSKALMLGLVHGGNKINAMISLQNMTFPILHWACKWKCLLQCQWEGQDDIVQLILSTPGVNVNATAESGVNAAFHAVKYGTPFTLDLLIDAGINLNQKDEFGRSCLYNAVERPSPEMLRRVLAQVPATEMFPSKRVNSDGTQSLEKVSAADCFFDLFYRETRDHHQGEWAVFQMPISWIILGPPSLNDMAESLIMVRRSGAEFVHEAVWLAASGVMKGLFKSRNTTEDALFKRLVECVLGFWLPPNAQCQVDDVTAAAAAAAAGDDENVECPICLNPLSRRVTLYCGHTFCRDCIIRHGDERGTCPMCRSRLCKDIAPRYNDSGSSSPVELRNLSRQLGLDESRPLSLGTYLSALSDEQIKQEAMAQGFHEDSDSADVTRRKLSHACVEGVKRSRATVQGGELFGQASVTLELSSSASFGSKGAIQVSPKDGPAMIAIEIKGVPVVASLSNNSVYTFISKAVADTFRLKRLENLTSNRFRSPTGDKTTGLSYTCLDNFTFKVAEVEVSLRNAVEVSPGMIEGVGVQLGGDFFLSAAFCVVDVNVGAESDGSSYMRFNGWHSWLLKQEEVDRPSIQPFSESLRYYSHDGKMAKVRLLHNHPLGHHQVGTISIKPDEKLNECSWCCRCFPKGMLCCSSCEEAGLEPAFYCDQACLDACGRVHRARRRAAHPKRDD